MAVSKEQKKLFAEKVKVYKNCLDDIKKEMSTLKAVAKKNDKLEPYVLMRLSFLSFQMVNTLVMMNTLSVEIQNRKNDTYLNDARKEISNHLNDLSKLMGSDIDGSLTENKEKLVRIARMTPKQRLHLVEGFRAATEGVKDAMGKNSKWVWAFPDLHYKNAVLAKNIFDFTAYQKASRDPNEEYFRERNEMLQFIIDEAQFAAQEYRNKFELSTNEVSELQVIERLFELVKKIHTMTGNRNEIDKVSIQIDSTREKIEALMAEKKGKKKK